MLSERRKICLYLIDCSTIIERFKNSPFLFNQLIYSLFILLLQYIQQLLYTIPYLYLHIKFDLLPTSSISQLYLRRNWINWIKSPCASGKLHFLFYWSIGLLKWLATGVSALPLFHLSVTRHMEINPSLSPRQCFLLICIVWPISLAWIMIPLLSMKKWGLLDKPTNPFGSQGQLRLIRLALGRIHVGE